MTFYINSNLTPLEAVKYYKELQIHPIIEQLAYVSDNRNIEDLLDLLNGIIYDQNLETADEVKEAIYRLTSKYE